MALFEANGKETKKQYLVMLDKSGENVVAYVNPANKVSIELLKEALEKAKIKVDLRETTPEIEKLELV